MFLITCSIFRKARYMQKYGGQASIKLRELNSITVFGRGYIEDIEKISNESSLRNIIRISTCIVCLIKSNKV